MCYKHFDGRTACLLCCIVSMAQVLRQSKRGARESAERGDWLEEQREGGGGCTGCQISRVY